ncbi:hypothetical protein HPB50_004343 [Hyalomma asiaticum]|uniref:Uncharacterized protein n=1 Tax=Hyalomma asiaticum TaxID=266040 RepID=A0ACB7SEX7_HYAAI|nr:hypothetical protein HPB50_004343 [Hyalomma asiaticum]
MLANRKRKAKERLGTRPFQSARANAHVFPRDHCGFPEEKGGFFCTTGNMGNGMGNSRNQKIWLEEIPFWTDIYRKLQPANVYAGKLQRARLVRCAMVDYPLFVLQVLFFALISITQLVTYIQYLYRCCPTGTREFEDYMRFDDKLVLVTERKREFWRNVSFVLVSFNGLSLVASIAVQVLVCIPVSFLHSPWKIPFIYAAGAFTAAQVTFVCRYGFNVGASAAIYAVLWAHLVDVLVNRSQFSSVAGRVIVVLIYTAADAVQAFYLNRIPSIGTLPHLIGVAIGCTMGVVVLRKNRGRKWEKWLYRIITWLHWAVVVFALEQAAMGATY